MLKLLANRFFLYSCREVNSTFSICVLSPCKADVVNVLVKSLQMQQMQPL